MERCPYLDVLPEPRDLVGRSPLRIEFLNGSTALNSARISTAVTEFDRRERKGYVCAQRSRLGNLRSPSRAGI